MPFVLDPRIFYEGVQQDYANDSGLLEYLEEAKSALHTHFTLNYSTHVPSLNADATGPTSTTADGSSSLNFTSRYKKKDHVACEELDEYFKLPREDFDTCKPLQWWVSRQAQFPGLYSLARDLLTIPGTYSFFQHNLFLCTTCQVLLLQSSEFSQGAAIQFHCGVQVFNHIPSAPSCLSSSK
jgi:hypothetical protein